MQQPGISTKSLADMYIKCKIIVKVEVAVTIGDPIFLMNNQAILEMHEVSNMIPHHHFLQIIPIYT